MRENPIDFRLLLPALSILLLAASPASRAERWDVEESRTLEETLSFAAASEANLLVIDNVHGSIRVTGYDGDEVRMVAHETVRARSQSHLARAREEAGLRVDADAGAIYLVVDGPFREPDGGIRWRRDLGYELHYDFEVRVPRRTRLEAKTINAGDIEIEGVEGDFDVSNVNGAVDLERVAGHGRFRTVNGGIDASFTRRPEGECHFKTVNGNLDVAFPGDLAADLRFKTFNGDVYTDFDYTQRALARPEPKRKGDRTVWKSLGYGVRIAGGGPEMSFETLNGDVYLKKTEH